MLSPDELARISPTPPPSPAPLRSLPWPSTPTRRIISPRSFAVLHPGAGLYSRVYRDLARPGVGVSSPSLLLDWVHDTVDGRGDRVRCLVKVDVDQRTELDNPGERCAAYLIRHVQRSECDVRGMMRCNAVIAALGTLGSLRVFGCESFRIGVVFCLKTAHNMCLVVVIHAIKNLLTAGAAP